MIQELITDAIANRAPIPLTSMTRDREFRGINFGSIVKSCEVLEKRGIINIDRNNKHEGWILSKGPRFNLRKVSVASSLKKIAKEIQGI